MNYSHLLQNLYYCSIIASIKLYNKIVLALFQKALKRKSKSDSSDDIITKVKARNIAVEVHRAEADLSITPDQNEVNVILQSFSTTCLHPNTVTCAH